MEQRVARLEAHVEHIQRDTTEIKGDLRSFLKMGLTAFILTWGGLIALAAMIAKGFGWF